MSSVTVPIDSPRGLARRLLPPLLGGTLLACAFVGLFTAAVHAPTPNDVRVAVVAPAPLQARVAAGLDRAAPGGFDLVRYGSEAAARAALRDQDVSGVLVATGPRPRLLVASAAGAPTAAVVRTALGAAAGPHVTVADVRPLPPNDARGLSTFFLVAGTTLGSLLFGALLFVLARDVSTSVLLATLVAFAVLVGLAAAVTVDLVVGAVTGAFGAVAAVAALLSLAVAAPAAALSRLLGPAGIALAAILVLLLSLASSGGSVGPQLVPDFFSTLSGVLPAGAAQRALRSVVYFDGDAVAGSLAVLEAWALGGLLLEVVANRTRTRQTRLARKERVA